MKYTTLVINHSVRFSAPKVVRVLGACLGLLLFCSPVFGQLNYGRILGGVTDQSGGAVAGAKVEVIDVARGISHPLTTDAAGEYNASSLLPGTYTVRAEATGFKTIERQNVLVEVGQDVRVDLTVQPGEQTQTVTVTESIPVMNTTNAQLGGVLENQTIADLPLNGREFQKLLTFRPGVRANGLDIYVNGNRADNNMWLLDGLDNYNTISSSGPVAGGQSGFDQATILPLDAIQEVNVVQSPKAEYGWKPGSENNVGLKSGTNSMHGIATAFGRDGALDAKNPFLPAALPKADDVLEQFSASLGGPIKKDKLFYFVAYEGQRYTIGSPRTTQVPTSASIGGSSGASNSFPDAITALQKLGYTVNNANPALRLSQLSLNLAGCTLVPAVSCNASAGLFPNSTNSATIATELDNIGGSDSGIAKVDYHYNDHNSFNAEYFLGEGSVQQASTAIQNYWRNGHFTRGDVGRAVWVWTPNSAWLNEFRAGYEAQQSPQGPNECDNPASGAPNYVTTFGFVTGLNLTPPICGFPSVAISGFNNLGAGAGQVAEFKTASFLDAVSYTRGKHLIKFGGEMHFTHFIGLPGSLSNIAGNVSFGSLNAFKAANLSGTATSLEDFLTGTAASGAVIAGNPNRQVTYNRFAGFVQDDWRITPNVILNIGVRYEYVEPISDRNNLLGTFDPNTPTGLAQQGKQLNQLYQNSKDDFAPRLGLAWDITGKGTTVVRVGGTIVYNSDQSLKVFLNSGNAGLNFAPTGFAFINPDGSTAVPAGTAGNIQTGTLSLQAGGIPWAVNTPIFGGANTSGLACGNGLGTNPSPCNIGGIDPNYRRAYVTTWNLAIQHAFTNTLSLNVAYIGDHGTHLGANINLNQPIGPANSKTAPNEQTERPYYSRFPWLGNIINYSSFARSNYNALDVILTERAGHGLNFTIGYSFSHALDDTSAETGYTTLNNANPNLDYANSDQDPRQNLSVTASYNIPGRKAPGQLLEGWQVNTVVHLVGGVPFNAYDTTSDLAGTGGSELWTLAGNRHNFMTGTPGTIPCFGQPGVAAGGGNPAVGAGSFTKASNCITVAAGTFANPVANMPAACVAAASAEATNPTVVAAGDPNSTGLKALANFGCYYQNGSVIVPPAQGTFGTMSRTALLSAPLTEWDLSVTKSWKLNERFSAQFRAELFNIINHTQYATPSSNPNAPTSFGVTQATPNSNDPVVGEGGARQIQFGLKLVF
jgi:hypothetical protein